MDSTPNPESRQDLDLTTSLQKLSVILEEHPESLALGSSDIRAAALEATKHIFDICVYHTAAYSISIGSFFS